LFSPRVATAISRLLVLRASASDKQTSHQQQLNSAHRACDPHSPPRILGEEPPQRPPNETLVPPSPAKMHKLPAHPKTLTPTRLPKSPTKTLPSLLPPEIRRGPRLRTAGTATCSPNHRSSTADRAKSTGKHSPNSPSITLEPPPAPFNTREAATRNQAHLWGRPSS